jgi:hypothetical protein
MKRLSLLGILALLNACSKLTEQEVGKIVKLTGLKNNQTIAAYLVHGGATTPDVTNVGFYDAHTDLSHTKGDIFRVIDNSVLLKRISEDTVLILYGGGRIQTQEVQARGITFLYGELTPGEARNPNTVN